MSESRINPSKSPSPSSTNTSKNSASKLKTQDRLEAKFPENSKQEDRDSSLELGDLHEAQQEFEKSFSEIEAKRNTKKKSKEENEIKLDKKDLGFFEKFLYDDSPMRIFFALGNEIAESFKELAEHLLPKPLASALYWSFWSLAGIATGSRVITNATKAKEGEALKAGAKILVHLSNCSTYACCKSIKRNPKQTLRTNTTTKDT